jgi:hypothetical protein
VLEDATNVQLLPIKTSARIEIVKVSRRFTHALYGT